MHPFEDELEVDDLLEPDPTVTGPGCTSAGYPMTTAANNINPTAATAATFVLRGIPAAGRAMGARVTTAPGAAA